jgi:hypothetical protein
LSMIMHNGWFSTLGAASSLSVCCRATIMVLRRASFRNLRKVLSILRSNYTWLWLVDTTTRLMSSPKCRSVEVINNPARPGSNHMEVNYINFKQQQQQQ